MQWKKYIGMIISLMIGGAGGYFLADYVLGDEGEETGKIFRLLILLALVIGALYVQIVIHEAGHLVGGLISGYHFLSFRIGSFMWVKKEGKLKLKRFTLAGTGGQCLMSPPDLVDGKIPVILYNLGGALMNLITGALFWGLYVLVSGEIFSTAFFLLAAAGLFTAMLNGIPMRAGNVDNDGYNAVSICRNPVALRAFWLQMKVNEEMARGTRLRDMPEEWFALPKEEDMKNSMAAAVAVFACNRLMDQQRFEEADSLMANLLEIKSGMVEIHRYMLICDRIYCELIAVNRPEKIEEMYSTQQKKFMKSMKNFPSVLRTEYALALLHEKDREKAEKMKLQFEKCAETYPYSSDIQSERELLNFAEETWKKFCVA